MGTWLSLEFVVDWSWRSPVDFVNELLLFVVDPSVGPGFPRLLYEAHYLPRVIRKNHRPTALVRAEVDSGDVIVFLGKAFPIEVG